MNKVKFKILVNNLIFTLDKLDLGPHLDYLTHDTLVMLAYLEYCLEYPKGA